MSNALVLVGDFKTDTALAVVEKYFSRIPRGKADAPDVATLEVEQTSTMPDGGEMHLVRPASERWHERNPAVVANDRPRA